MEKRKFEIEGEVENQIDEAIDNEELSDLEEESDSGCNRLIYILLTIFIFLFLLTATAFVYFQIYQGNGNWDFNLTKIDKNYSELEKLRLENRKLTVLVDSLSQIQVEKSYSDTSSFQVLFSNDMSGDKYEVQIGFFKSFDFSVYNNNLLNMNVESSNGSHKLLIGRFNSFEEACRFRKDIISIGIQGAFIVKKTDGKRVPFDGTCP